MKHNRIAKVHMIAGYQRGAYVTYYGKELFRSQLYDWNVSGAIERSNDSRAVAECEKWAEQNGYDGIEVVND